jgi:hypothetical protein
MDIQPAIMLNPNPRNQGCGCGGCFTGIIKWMAILFFIFVFLVVVL